MRVNNIFKQLEGNAEKLAKGQSVHDLVPAGLQDAIFDDDDDDNERHSKVGSKYLSMNPTRWEKCVVAVTQIVTQVGDMDPDGLDIVCFGGTDDGEFDEGTDKAKISVFRSVNNARDIEEMVTSKLPSGPCIMGKTMDYILRKSFDTCFTARPCSILVLTAGQPDDSKRLEKSLKKASERVAKEWKREKKKEGLPLSVTFVHIGDDEKAETYMQYLADEMVSKSVNEKTREVVDIVDTIQYKDIQAAMKEIRGSKTKKSSSAGSAVIGAFAGAAMGVAGMRVYNKKQAKKRNKKGHGWSGKWWVSVNGTTMCTIDVSDDRKGKLTIEGFPNGKTFGRYYSTREGYGISYRDPGSGWKIDGEIGDETTIFWSDGTRWDEFPHGDSGKSRSSLFNYAAAGAAGAASGGAIGYLLDKNFFKTVSKKDQCDYVILVDRSETMAVRDKNTLTGMDEDSDEDSLFEEYQPEKKDGIVDKFNDLSTGQKMAVGAAGVAAIGGVVAAGVGIANVAETKNGDDDRPEWEKNAPFREKPPSDYMVNPMYRQETLTDPPQRYRQQQPAATNVAYFSQPPTTPTQDSWALRSQQASALGSLPNVIPSSDEKGPWYCSACTYLNLKSESLVCEICPALRYPDLRDSYKATKDDLI